MGGTGLEPVTPSLSSLIWPSTIFDESRQTAYRSPRRPWEFAHLGPVATSPADTMLTSEALDLLRRRMTKRRRRLAAEAIQLGSFAHCHDWKLRLGVNTRRDS